MRFPRTLFWKNNANSGAENICELDDPQQTCIIANAGEQMSDTRATELGIMEYLSGGDAPQAGARSVSAPGPQTVREAQKAHEQLRPLSVEERAYVENAPVSGHVVTEAERATAGALGAEWTGPTPQEVTQAGGDYQAAADKAAQAQGAAGEAPKPDEPKPETPTVQTPAPPRAGRPS